VFSGLLTQAIHLPLGPGGPTGDWGRQGAKRGPVNGSIGKTAFHGKCGGPVFARFFDTACDNPDDPYRLADSAAAGNAVREARPEVQPDSRLKAFRLNSF